jgi:hypothetical protein
VGQALSPANFRSLKQCPSHTSFTAATLAIGLAALAQDSGKQDVKKAGQDVKQAGKDTGQAAKNGAKGVKKGTKKAVNKSAKATDKGAKKVEKKTNPSS